MTDRITIQFSTAAPSSFVPFTKGWPNRWSKAIRMLGHSKFSHVDFLLDPFDAGAIHPKVFLADPLYLQPRDWRNPNQWFCMELIVVCCEKGGLWGENVLIPYDKDRITPADGYMVMMM